jgi:hypothetical protein
LVELGVKGRKSLPEQLKVDVDVPAELAINLDLPGSET